MLLIMMHVLKIIMKNAMDEMAMGEKVDSYHNMLNM